MKAITLNTLRRLEAPANRPLWTGMILGYSLVVTLLILIGGVIPVVLGQPAYSAPQGSRVFADPLDGSGTNSWATDGEHYFFANGSYHLKSTTEPLFNQALPTPQLADFILEISVTKLSGPNDRAFGVLFRQQIPLSYYGAAISGDGRYSLVKVADGRQTVMESGTSSAIRRGNNSRNQLKVVASGPHILFYINSRLVAGQNDSNFSSGQIAFLVFDPLEVTFSQLRMYAARVR